MGHVADAEFSVGPAERQQLAGKEILAAAVAANLAVDVVLNPVRRLLCGNPFGPLLHPLQVFELALERILADGFAGRFFKLPKFFFQVHDGLLRIVYYGDGLP